MNQPTKELSELRTKLLNILEEHAEDEIENGEGTFLTFRTEYVLNDLEDLLSKNTAEAREVERNRILQMINPTIKEASQHDSIQESESASVRYGVFKGLALLQRKIMESPNKKETKKEL